MAIEVFVKTNILEHAKNLYAGKGERNLLFILPNKRAINYFYHIVGADSGVCRLPDALAMQDLPFRILKTEKRIITEPVERLLYLRRAVESVKKDMAPLFRGREKEFLAEFYRASGFIAALIGFFDEVVSEQIDFKKLRVESLYTDYQAHIEILEAIYGRYMNMLETDGAIDPPMLYESGEVDERYIAGFDGIFFIAPGILTNAEIGLMKKVGEIKDVHVYLENIDCLPPANRKFYRDQEVREEQDNAQSAKTADFVIREFRDVFEQCGFVIESVKELLKSGVKPEGIAVVLPDESFSELLLKSSEASCFNFSMGMPFTSHIYYSFIHALRKLLAAKKGLMYPTHELIALMTLPLLKASGGEIRREINELTGAIYRNNLLYTALNKKDMLAGIIKSFEESVLKARNLAGTAQSLITVFLEMEAHFQDGFKDEVFKNPLFREGRDVFYQQMNKLACMKAAESIHDNPLKLLDMLAEQLSRQTYPVVERGPVSVMGVLETRLLDFDAVIIPDMNEGIFPRYSEKDLFLNTRLRVMTGLPTYEDRERLYRMYFGRLTAVKKSYIGYVQDENRKPRSRFVEELIFRLGMDENKDVKSRTKDYRAAVIPGGISDIGIQPVSKSAFPLELLKEIKLSQSAIAAYLQCPLKFYLEYLLGMKEPDDLKQELDNAEVGNIFHEVLYLFYKDHLFEKDEFPGDFYGGMLGILHKVIEKNPLTVDSVVANLYLSQILKRFAGDLARREREDFENGWRIEYLEKSWDVDDFHGYKLKGKMDRVDKNGQTGKYRVIDYKTGASGTNLSKQIRHERFTDPQMPFYFLLLSRALGLDPDDVDDLFYYRLNTDRGLEVKAFSSIEEHFAENRSGYLMDVEAKIKAIIDDMSDASKEMVTGENEACRYCTFVACKR